MIAGYPVRVWIGVLSVILFSLLSAHLALWGALDPPPWTVAQDEISRYEARFRRLRSALPPKGVVGYLAEPRRLDRPADSKYSKGFYLTEYALVPVVVVNSTEPVLVIGNFRSVGSEREVTDPTLILLRDFGDGILLFRHWPR
jgi:hypothetical protein